MHLHHRAARADVAPRGAVLLLHGAAYSSGPMFDSTAREGYSLVQALSDRGVDVFALDFAGYGKSEPAANEQSLSDFVADAAAALDQIVRESGALPVVVGWSWGAQVAASLASERDVAGVVFWGGCWGRSPENVPLPLRSLAVPDSRWRTNTPEHARSDFIDLSLYPAGIPDAVGEEALILDPVVPSDARRAFCAGLPLFDAEAIGAPLLAIHGEGDPLVTADDTSELLRATAGPAWHVVIPEAEHAVQFSRRRTEFADALAEFVGERTGT